MMVINRDHFKILHLRVFVASTISLCEENANKEKITGEQKIMKFVTHTSVECFTFMLYNVFIDCFDQLENVCKTLNSKQC
jgi:hypothetical protein